MYRSAVLYQQTSYATASRRGSARPVHSGLVLKVVLAIAAVEIRVVVRIRNRRCLVHEACLHRFHFPGQHFQRSQSEQLSKRTAAMLCTLQCCVLGRSSCQRSLSMHLLGMVDQPVAFGCEHVREQPNTVTPWHRAHTHRSTRRSTGIDANSGKKRKKRQHTALKLPESMAPHCCA